MPTWLWLGEREGRNDISFRYWLKVWYAQPRWASKEKVYAIYLEAHRRRQNGERVHVDHEVPLKSPWVCGLHNEFNLRIIPEKENLQRSNHFWPHGREQLDMLPAPAEVEPHQMSLF